MPQAMVNKKKWRETLWSEFQGAIRQKKRPQSLGEHDQFVSACTEAQGGGEEGRECGGAWGSGPTGDWKGASKF